MAMVAGAVHDRDLPPWQPGQLRVQGRLVGLDDHQIVGAAVDQEGAWSRWVCNASAVTTTPTRS
jgi:hypothetical protein